MFEDIRLKNKIVKRKGSKTTWKVWYADEDVVQVMSWNTYKPMSRMIKRKVFDKSWEIVR